MDKDPHLTDSELLNMIRKKFELELNSEFLLDADFLMDSLSFTKNPIDTSHIPLAWESFQIDQEGFVGFQYDDYPILEAIAQWYFDHREDTGRDETAMVARALAVYEYLMQQVRGREADSEYESILAGIGPTIVFLYIGIGDSERAKFYVQLLELEFLVGRLDEEDYDQVIAVHTQSLLKSNAKSQRTEQVKFDPELFRLSWDTISDRERKIEMQAKDIARLKRSSTDMVIESGTDATRRRLINKFGSDWEKLEIETRDYLLEGVLWLDNPLSGRPPGVVPSAFFLAVKTELFARLFPVNGKLNQDLMRRVGASNPLMLLIMFSQGHRLPISERKTLSERLAHITGGKKLLTSDAINNLSSLLMHRNHAQHSEDKRPYTKSDLEKYLATIWNNDWLVKFLLLLHSE